MFLQKSNLAMSLQGSFVTVKDLTDLAQVSMLAHVHPLLTVGS